jgi:hypothetical protein
LLAGMFLERKFSIQLDARLRFEPALCPALERLDRSALPELVYDVSCNLQLLLLARRGYDHVLGDFGLSASDGGTGHEARVETLQAEVPETFRRYERRFQLERLDFDVDPAGDTFMKATGRIDAAHGTLVFRFGIVSRTIVELAFRPDGP